MDKEEFAALEAEVRNKLSEDPAWVQVEQVDMPEYRQIRLDLLKRFHDIVYQKENQAIRSLSEAAAKPFRPGKLYWFFHRSTPPKITPPRWWLARQVRIVGLDGSLFVRLWNEVAHKEILELRKRIRELEAKP